MTRRAASPLMATALAFAASAAGAQGSTASADEAFYLRAATCAAALEIDQQALLARARAGAPGLRPGLVELTQLGFAYVGTAYLRGLRNPRGDTLLAAARVEEKTRAPVEHAGIAGACRVEAAALLGEATSVERWLVHDRAAARVDRYLAAPAPAPASAVDH